MPCYRHPDREAQPLTIADAAGTPVPLCRDCLTAFSVWLNDSLIAAPTGPDA